MRYTYVEYHEGWKVLYDNVANPEQVSNLINQPSVAALQSRLKADMERLFKCRGAGECSG